MLKKGNQYDITFKNFEKEDINEDYLSWLNNKRLLKYSQQKKINYNYQKAVRYLDFIKKNKSLFKKIILKKNKLFIGTITAHFNFKKNEADIGILIGNSKYRKKGLALQSWLKMIKYLFRYKNIKKITGGARKQNKPMIKIFKKSGMRLINQKKNFYNKAQKYVKFQIKKN